MNNDEEDDDDIEEDGDDIGETPGNVLDVVFEDCRSLSMLVAMQR